MPIQAIGHAVLKVRNLDRAIAFYNGVLGMPLAHRWEEMGMAFFTLGNHHDFAVRAVGENAPGPDPKGVGLFHLAFKVGNSVEEFLEMKAHLESQGVKIDHLTNHKVSYSIYLNDPDGNTIELYVDISDSWKQNPADVANILPLKL